MSSHPSRPKALSTVQRVRNDEPLPASRFLKSPNKMNLQGC